MLDFLDPTVTKVLSEGGTLICVILFFPSHNSSSFFSESNPVICWCQHCHSEGGIRESDSLQARD